MDSTYASTTSCGPTPGVPESAARSYRDREHLLALEKEARAAAERAVHRISALQTVTAALSEAVTLQQVAEIIVREGVGSLGADQGMLYLYRSGEAIELVSHRGLSSVQVSQVAHLVLSEHLVLRTIREGQPLWATTLEEVRATFPQLLTALGNERPWTAMMALPLSVAGRVVGALLLGFALAQVFPEDQRIFIMSLVRHCAQAVDRARLYEAERQSKRRFELLARVGDLCASSIEYETTLAHVAQAGLPDLGDYAFFDIRENEEVRRVARGVDGVLATLDGARFPAEARLRLPGQAFHPEATSKWLVALSPGVSYGAYLETLEIRSLLSVPLAAHDQVLGWLTLVFGPSGRCHTRGDLEIAQELARRGALAVQNAILHRASREANLRSERAGRTRDEFLGVVSHELRTPLNAVLGWAQLLRGPAAGDPAVLAKGLRVIDKNARAQAKLIEDILDVSRIISGKLRLDLRPVELESVVRASLEVMRPTADAKRVDLSVRFEVRPAVLGDPDRLQQVVWNLLSNAVKFTPEGGRVQVTLRREGTNAIVVVRDSGNGIEAGFLPFVFERFRQADASPTRRHGGLGLGLSIVRHLVELHGGTVRAESEGTGRGATFTVRLPARDEEDHDAHVTDPGGQKVRIDGLKVLVVDDQADAREIIAAMLSSAGAEVAVAGSSHEAFEALPSFRPDVLVSDVGMPGEDGYALLRRVRASDAPFAHVPAVALTAYASNEDAQRAYSAGFHLHIPKPAEPATLTAAIANITGRESLNPTAAAPEATPVPPHSAMDWAPRR